MSGVLPVSHSIGVRHPSCLDARWYTVVKKMRNHPLAIMVALLSEVLVLVVGFAVPIVDAEGTQDFLDPVGYECFRIITDEQVHGPMLPDVFHECSRKAFVARS